jgi:putative nucleotidyltransferase with HDIG domain
MAEESVNLVAGEGAWALAAGGPLEIDLPASARTGIAEWLTSGKLELPILPEASAAIMSMTASEDYRLQDLVDVIQRDPSLAAHLLRVANSPLYAPRYPFVSLRHAIGRLGVTELRRVAVTIACQTQVFRVRGWETELHELFVHCLTTALYAAEIAKLVHLEEEPVFLGGLLHDVGYAVVLQGIDGLNKDLGIELSRMTTAQVAARFHTELGARLVERWGLAPRFAEVIHHHHEIVSPPTTNLAVIELADALAYGAPELVSRLAEHGMFDSLDLPAGAVDGLAAKRPQVVALAAALM